MLPVANVVVRSHLSSGRTCRKTVLMRPTFGLRLRGFERASPEVDRLTPTSQTPGTSAVQIVGTGIIVLCDGERFDCVELAGTE